jgi:hypothetical protein
MSPETARSIASERINPPSKTVDKIEVAPLLSLFTFADGPKYTPLPQSTNHAFFFALCIFEFSRRRYSLGISGNRGNPPNPPIIPISLSKEPETADHADQSLIGVENRLLKPKT